ncbi:MAG: hypothetical protein MJ192_03150 [Clostridia bacterium]|nr:hypothetical protein [Clostridia bacterium]
MITSAVIAAHAAAYPAMQPTDAVKLVYQAVFGGGHLIRDEEACRRYLNAEYASVPQTAGPLAEVIAVPGQGSRGIVRVHLSALDAHGLAPDRLAAVFIASAPLIKGTRAAFEDSLSLLREAADSGSFRFDRAALDTYLDEYLRIPGLPPVSHSPEYREAYAPHYRVVDAATLEKELGIIKR